MAMMRWAGSRPIFEGRTVRYEISFDRNAVTEAEQRWHQLLLFAKPFDAIVMVN